MGVPINTRQAINAAKLLAAVQAQKSHMRHLQVVVSCKVERANKSSLVCQAH